MSNPTRQQSTIAQSMSRVDERPLIEELQSALDQLRLEDLPVPGLTPFLGTPTPDDEPDPDGDRDYPGIPVCHSCNHDLELDAELRCSRCGAA